MNYGLRFESELVRELTDKGYIAIRSAASKTIDVFAAKAGHKPILIEAKATRQNVLKSYGQEILSARVIQRQVGICVRVAFVVKYNRTERLWLWIDTMKIDWRRSNVKDKIAATKWLERKKKMLAQKEKQSGTTKEKEV